MATANELKLWIDSNWADKANKLKGTTAQRPETCPRDTIYFNTETKKPIFWVDDRWVTVGDDQKIMEWVANCIWDNVDETTGNVYAFGISNGEPFLEQIDPTLCNAGSGNDGSIGGFSPVYDPVFDSFNTADLRRFSPVHIKTIAQSAAVSECEPKITKNSAFNKNFGGTGSADYVSKSDHSHPNYSATSHAHSNLEPSFSKNTAFNKNLGTTSNTVSEGNHNHRGGWIRVLGGETNVHHPFVELETQFGRGYRYKVIADWIGMKVKLDETVNVAFSFNSTNDAIMRTMFREELSVYQNITPRGFNYYLYKNDHVNNKIGNEDTSTHSYTISDDHRLSRRMEINFVETGNSQFPGIVDFQSKVTTNHYNINSDEMPIQKRISEREGTYSIVRPNRGDDLVHRIYLHSDCVNPENSGTLTYAIYKREE
ncbi:MAG: hypothetical protein GY804_04130 [Alphaproteobacteria bacterium]|nr:hypothetical protein [Alphaproteobacteria bacterium]